MKFGYKKFCFVLVSLGPVFILPIAQAQEETMSVEEFLQRLSSVRKVLERRDPFEENNPSYIKEEKKDTNETVVAELVTNLEDLPPLERFPVESYLVKAVLLGDRVPRALVKLPSGGSLVVQPNMKMGDKGGVIEKIGRAGIVVTEKIKNNFGSYDNVHQTLPVGSVKEKTGEKK